MSDDSLMSEYPTRQGSINCTEILYDHENKSLVWHVEMCFFTEKFVIKVFCSAIVEETYSATDV